MKFHSTGLSYTLAVLALIIYIFFITSSIGVSGLLLSFAIGMIAAAFIEPLELVVALVIVAGIVLTVASKQLFIQQILASKTEGFDPGMGTGKSISDRVVSLEEGTYRLPANRPRVKAVYSEIGFGYAPVQDTEGFQDVPQDDEEGEEADSTPAPKSEAANTNKLVDKDAADVAAAAATAKPDTASTVPGGGIQPSAASSAAALRSPLPSSPPPAATCAAPTAALAMSLSALMPMLHCGGLCRNSTRP